MKHILFVCVENSCRSQMAEAFARRHGNGTVKAFSAGTRPSGVVHPKVITCMRERGFDMSGHFSKGLEDLSDVDFDVEVIMGRAEPAGVCARQIEHWDLLAPKDLPLDQVRLVRDEIERRVKHLLAMLSESELAWAH